MTRNWRRRFTYRGKTYVYTDKNRKLLDLLAEMRRHDLAAAKKARGEPREAQDGLDADGWCESYWR